MECGLNLSIRAVCESGAHDSTLADTCYARMWALCCQSLDLSEEQEIQIFKLNFPDFMMSANFFFLF